MFKNAHMLAIRSLAVLCFLDAVLTSIFVSILGYEAEANPIMRYVMESCSLYGFFAIKMLVTAGFCFGAYKAINRRWVFVSTLALNAVMLYVVTMGVLMVRLILISN